jgi:hypothetical protein
MICFILPMEAFGGEGAATTVRITLSNLQFPEPPSTGGPSPVFSAYEGEVC